MGDIWGDIGETHMDIGEIWIYTAQYLPYTSPIPPLYLPYIPLYLSQDINSDGVISMDEFTAWYLRRRDTREIHARYTRDIREIQGRSRCRVVPH